MSRPEVPGADRQRGPAILETMKAPLRRLRSGYHTLTAPLRGWPSALIIGAQSSGTTSLFNYLVRHPAVLPPLGKEVHYFDLYHARGLRWYRGRFPYGAPERAARLLPDAKLVALLRNPVDRAFSHYQHEVREGRETLSFAEAIDKEPERLAGEEERLRAVPGAGVSRPASAPDRGLQAVSPGQVRPRDAARAEAEARHLLRALQPRALSVAG